MPTVQQAFQDANDFVIGKVYALESDTIQQLYNAYLIAYLEISAQLEVIWSTQGIGQTWNATNLAARNELLSQITQIMNRLDPEVTRLLFDNIGDAYRAGIYGTNYVLDSSVGAMLMTPSQIPLLPTDAVAAQVLAPYLGQTWLDRYSDNRTEFELRIKRALIQSQIQGESMQEAQRRIRDELGIVTDRRFKVDRWSHRRNFNRTTMIARSEIMRAANNGTVAVYQANSDVLKGWEFKTSLDERVCPRCGPLDGRQFSWNNQPIDGEGSTSETLPPPIHPQCRCAVLPVLINQDLEQRIVGKRETFTDWAAQRGITHNMYGQAFDLRGKSAPKTETKEA